MPNILSTRNIRTLARFATTNELLAFDFDGTLAPIVSDPNMARMRPRTRRLLSAVARRYPCVVISGRARRDLSRRVGRIPVVHLSGNYGLEPWGENASYPSLVRGWVRLLEKRLATYPGVVVENKTYSVTVHYRNALNRKAARWAIDAAL